ncbi:4,5-dihydroxyphthalate decarboxylase [Noviherbaspirillum humi]|uniref:4,5-dihydroxyphthalate decarboxylase n=1 Tax=Noviherbaspirillum humi TaxID=1688639 RepID=A0A239IAV0_9BURK|nr:PhnD/SsuA/transferrin family substrate-binding protein [Noviherbaspirillum humi]SNS89504.1 4,5-dihydroxyphthalate decarboxylase [Noviherbaspirillum humi]
MTVPLSVAVWDYDRTRALFDRRVAIEACDATYLPLMVEETFFRALRSSEFDVAELSLSSYTALTSRGACPYVAIPVFMSRMFRHSAIYVRKDSGIREPKDLIGRKVGVPEYQLTAPVWVRGILEDEYGVKPSDIRWRTGGVEEPGRHEKVAINLPADVECEAIPVEETLNQWLVDGKIDALVAPRAPSSYAQGHPNIARLFPDFRSVEKAYFKKTGIFPMMHVIGIRKELVAQHPWLASSVFKAFNEAKKIAQRDLSEVAALKTTMPWLPAEYEETVALMGQDYWPYGVHGNEKALETFLRYHHSQGLSARQMQIGDLFVPSTMEQVKI